METSYDQVLYRGFPYAQSHPDRLATLATLFGLEPAPVDRCRVLELGCGDGGNLLPMAFTFPNSTFVGFDLAETPIAMGQEPIAELGLKNLRLEAADILELGSDLGEFDYIIAHGVYSWVPEAVRDKLLAIAHDHLSRQGVAYVSYNALPGCHIRRMIRDMMLFHLRNVSDPEARIKEALDFLRMLQAAPESKENATPALLKHEINSLFERNPAVLFHDELGEIYYPIHFTGFMKHAEQHGLQYLAEANAFDMETGKFPSEVREQIERYSKEVRRDREQYMDFLKCRKFRQTLLCHADLSISDGPISSRVQGLYAASAATAVSAQPDLTGDRPEEFRGAKGAAMKTAHPLAKTAIGYLTEIWPQAIHFDELLKRCSERTGQPADAEALSEILMATYRAGLVELHVYPPGCVSTAGEYPSTTALVRWQAQHGHTVTTLRHTTIEATGGVETRLLTLLDGTRDRGTLAAELASMMEPALQHDKLMGELEANLGKLAKFGLLVA